MALLIILVGVQSEEYNWSKWRFSDSRNLTLSFVSFIASVILQKVDINYFALAVVLQELISLK